MADLVTDKADCSGSFPGGPGGGKDDHASHALDFGVHFQTNSRIHACNQQWQWEIQHGFLIGQTFLFYFSVGRPSTTGGSISKPGRQILFDYSQLPKSWRTPKNLEISWGEGFCGSRGDAAFSLCLG